MSRLTEAHVVTLEWSEDSDDGTVYADGHQSYEIDEKNDVAVFVDDKCTKVQGAGDFSHAVAIVLAHEAVVAYNLREQDRRRR